jgi:hypothetical protein
VTGLRNGEGFAFDDRRSPVRDPEGSRPTLSELAALLHRGTERGAAG